MKTLPATKQSVATAVTPGGMNVFEDLGFGGKEAAELSVKAELTLRVYQRIKQMALTQTAAAARLAISQPDVSKLMNGRHSGFSIDRLLSLLNALEMDVDIVVRPKSHRRRTSPGVVRVLKAAG